MTSAVLWRGSVAVGFAVVAGGVVAVACVAGGWLLRRRLALVEVAGPSMQPTLASGDRVLVRRASPRDLRAGLIVVVERPGTDGRWPKAPPRWPPRRREWLIKRVAAVPGDPLPAVVAGIGGSSVPAGSFVVLGDNAPSSYDSRVIGCIPSDRLLGVMVRPYRR